MKAKTVEPLQNQSVIALHEAIIKGIQEKKGMSLISLDLTDVSDSISDFFIICHGDSPNQVRAIGESVQQVVKEELSERVGHSEGFDNLEWVLLDYFDCVVHIFLKEKRGFYNLEELWNDARITEYED